MSDANLPVVDDSAFCLLLLGGEANLLHRALVVFLRVRPQRTLFAFGAILSGIAWMIAKVRVIFNRNPREEKMTKKVRFINGTGN